MLFFEDRLEPFHHTFHCREDVKDVSVPGLHQLQGDAVFAVHRRHHVGIPVGHIGVMHDVAYLDKGSVTVAANDGVGNLPARAVAFVHHDDELARLAGVVTSRHRDVGLRKGSGHLVKGHPILVKQTRVDRDMKLTGILPV